MKKLFPTLLLLVFSGCALAQNTAVLEDHVYYLKLLSGAKDSLYQSILSSFDRYIANHPSDYTAQLERCRLIQNAYYDSYEDLNPKYDEAETCSRNLLATFPDEPEVILYRADFLYGDSSIAFLEEEKSKIENDTVRLKRYGWRLFEKLSEGYYGADNYQQAVHFADLAMQNNDTLDMTLTLGRSYKALFNNPMAIVALSSRIDSTGQPWELNQKGKLLLQLGSPDKAMAAFRFAAKDTSAMQDSGGLAQAMIENGLANEARVYLVKELKSNTWNNHKALRKLLEYDLQYGEADSANSSYHNLVKEEFLNDPVGIYRLRLFLRAPLAAWTIAEIGRLLLLLILILLMCVVPYLWILPVYAAGIYFKKRGAEFPSTSSFTWGLRHFWAVSALWLLATLFTVLIFNYDYFVASVRSDSGVTETPNLVSQNQADIAVFFFSACLAFTLFFLKKTDIISFWPRLKGSPGDVLKGIGLAFALRVGLFVYAQLLKTAGLNESIGSSTMLSVKDSIVSINQFYHPLLGFLIVVILVPFYEEVLFRGIILSALERNMKFLLANILQAATFALVHEDWKLFPFFFAFGMMAGYYRNKSQSLVIPTSMHMTNNLLAFAAVLRMG